jgi:hypothetical protein
VISDGHRHRPVDEGRHARWTFDSIVESIVESIVRSIIDSIIR